MMSGSRFLEKMGFGNRDSDPEIDTEVLTYHNDSPINIILDEFKKWAGPQQRRQLTEALSNSRHRKKETKQFYALKVFSKTLGEVPKVALEPIIESIAPDTIVEKVPTEINKLRIKEITHLYNVNGRVYYEATAHPKDSEHLTIKTYWYDGEAVDKYFAFNHQLDSSGFIYGEVHMAEVGDKKSVVYMGKRGRLYDAIDHLIDFDIKKLAYVASSGSELYIVIEDKERFGQFDYSLHTRKLILEHSKFLPKKGYKKIKELLKEIDPIVYRKIKRIVKQLSYFRDEYLNPDQAVKLDKIIHSFSGGN